MANRNPIYSQPTGYYGRSVLGPGASSLASRVNLTTPIVTLPSGHSLTHVFMPAFTAPYYAPPTVSAEPEPPPDWRDAIWGKDQPVLPRTDAEAEAGTSRILGE